MKKKKNTLHQRLLILYKSLLSVRRPDQSKVRKLSLSRLWQKLVDYCTRPPEPKVWKKSNRKGEIWWDVYDPLTNTSATFSSEIEVKIWLETRYYRR